MRQKRQVSASVKEQVRRVLERLPDTCSLEDVRYQLCVIEKAQHGFEEIDSGKGIPHEEIEREFLE